MKKILFIDDDFEYQSVINELLLVEGYEVTLASTAMDGLKLYKENKYDLVISDLVMEKIDGLQLVSLLKRIDPKTPVIILTGHKSDEKEIQGLDLKVDDYIYKPVSMEVLLKRIELTINEKADDVEVLESKRDKLVVNLVQRRAYKNDEYIQLTGKEYALLTFFLSNKNIIFTREEILKHVWRITDDIVDLRTVDTHVKKLRAKLDIVSINSVRGLGYEWFE